MARRDPGLCLGRHDGGLPHLPRLKQDGDAQLAWWLRLGPGDETAVAGEQMPLSRHSCVAHDL
ncbi:hypothetical protein GX865_04365 [Candidatus Saccharibacteria bacterium]|nr:hypothetical protein [Candidatus Saccharibacteria bacterium]